jgi:FkbM family methyltransferase
VYLRQSYETYTVQLFQNAVRPGATVLDLGANIGYFSLVAAEKAGAQGSVYAFEPGPENLEVLKRNIEINGFANIRVVPKAVGEESKTVMLHLAADSDQHSLFVPPMVGTKGTIAVECIALDDFLDGVTPDVVKMDIEGNELRALDGMRETVAMSKSLVMFVELNPVCLRGAHAQARDLVLKLRGLGFELGFIDEDARAVGSVTDDYLRAIERRPPGWFANLYCTKGLPNPCSGRA